MSKKCGCIQTTSLATILIVTFAFIGIGALIVPAVHRANRRSKIISCVSNFSQLWRMENVYMASPQYGGPSRMYPSETGGAFWLKLTSTQPPLIENEVLSIYFCPVLDRDVVKGETDYLGPRADIVTLGDSEYIGSDRPENHGDGWGIVLRKSSDILELEGTEFLEAAARCRP